MTRSAERGGSKNPWPRLFVAAAFSQALYVVMARLSARPPGETWGARYTSARFFEETIVFLALWLGLLVFYGMAVRAVRGGASRSATLFVFLTAGSFRAALLPAPGFLKTSASEAVTPLDRGTVRLAQRFAASRFAKRLQLLGGATSAERVLVTLCDLGALALLPGLLKSAGLPPALSLVYGWNPLAVKESAGSGHLEPVSLLLLAFAVRAIVRKRALPGSLAYGATLTGSPVFLTCLPIVTRGLRFAILGALLVGALGWGVLFFQGGWSGDVLGAYAEGKVYGGSLFPAAAALCAVFLTRNRVYPLVGLLALWALFATYRAVRPGYKGNALPRESLFALGGWLMVSPVVAPWSWELLAFLAAFSPNRGWVIFTATAPLAYLSFGGRESFWLSFLQYFPAYAVLIFSGLRGESKPRSG